MKSKTKANRFVGDSGDYSTCKKNQRHAFCLTVSSHLQRYANLLEPKLDLSQSKSSDEEVHEQAETAASSAGSVPAPKTPLAGKVSVISFLRDLFF